MILVLSCLFHCLGLTFSLFLFCLAFSIIISWVMWVFFSHAVLILMSWEKIYKQISVHAYLIYLFKFIVHVEFHMKSKRKIYFTTYKWTCVHVLFMICEMRVKVYWLMYQRGKSIYIHKIVSKYMYQQIFGLFCLRIYVDKSSFHWK